MLSACAFIKIGTFTIPRSCSTVRILATWRLKIGTPDNTSQSHHLVVPYPESAFKINKIYKETSTNQPFRIMATPDKQYLGGKKKRSPFFRLASKKKKKVSNVKDSKYKHSRLNLEGKTQLQTKTRIKNAESKKRINIWKLTERRRSSLDNMVLHHEIRWY